ncbi:oxidoreductase [Tothia fuscella]|uniref:Oxidoreductase n=1 Tax=Tothia fuscella TaxID=1048955 RepID=A0A9P4P056_9PEZI|nr:oxidoreductase [Tothia fuscella]
MAKVAASILNKGTAYITGAGSGIGQYAAYSFAKYGAKNLALTDVNPKSLETTIAQLKKDYPEVQTLAITMDTSKEADVDRSIAETVAKFGRLDYAVNNAGIGGAPKGTVDLSIDDFNRTCSINLSGVWMCQRAQLRVMLKQDELSIREGRGAIVNVASMLGTVATSPSTPAAAYGATKFAVMGITKTDAVMYAPQKIRINAMCPGYVETPLLRSATSAGAMDHELTKVPMGRLAKMEEIGDAIVFLCSPMSSFMTGHGLLVDGGYTVQ